MTLIRSVPLQRLRAGFTLIEVTVVLAILGFVGGLVLGRGPPRSAALELRAASATVVQMMKAARTRAIATNRRVTVAFTNPPAVQVSGASARLLPPGIALSVTATADLPAGIEFLPDGSSSGGRVELSGGGRRVAVGVDWITGRVSIADGP